MQTPETQEFLQEYANLCRKHRRALKGFGKCCNPELVVQGKDFEACLCDLDSMEEVTERPRPDCSSLKRGDFLTDGLDTYWVAVVSASYVCLDVGETRVQMTRDRLRTELENGTMSVSKWGR